VIEDMSRRSLLGGIVATAAAPVLAAGAAGGQWSEEGLDRFRKQARDLGVRALVVRSGGRTIVSDGDVALPLRIASIRKSFLSALYGIANARKPLNLDAPLAEIGIDDYQPLTPDERRATVRHLLEARSGIYIPSSAETPAMKAARPARGSHAPSTFWYYNNWDFNALGEIYQRLTGLGLFSAFEHQIARPLGFEDFDPLEHARWGYDRAYPRFPAYNLWLSTRDMARFGQLFLQRGEWQGTRIVPADWVAESTRPISRTDHGGIMSGYAYLWWTATETSGPLAGAYTAAGNGGRWISVIPALDTVVALHPVEVEGQPQAPVYTKPGAYDALLGTLLAAWRA
jgi:CubicO group peptidase (beta-lactamase class C family)